MQGTRDSIVSAFMVIFVLSFAAAFGAGYLTARNFDAELAIKECEKNIPRNQSCKIIAVPFSIGD